MFRSVAIPRHFSSSDHRYKHQVRACHKPHVNNLYQQITTHQILLYTFYQMAVWQYPSICVCNIDVFHFLLKSYLSSKLWNENHYSMSIFPQDDLEDCVDTQHVFLFQTNQTMAPLAPVIHFVVRGSHKRKTNATNIKGKALTPPVISSAAILITV